MHARLSFAGCANWIEHSMNGNSFTRYLKTPKEVNTYLRRNEAADCRSEQRGTRSVSLTGGFPVHRDCMGAAWRPARTVAQALGIQLQLGDGTAKGVAVHAQLARGLALVSLAVLQHRENESLLEFTHAFGIGDAVFVHLQDQSFQLIFHNASLFRFGKGPDGPNLHRRPSVSPRCMDTCWGTVRNKSQPSRKRCRNSAGAAQIKARPLTSMNGAIRDCCNHPHCGAKEARASTITAQTTAPRKNPNTAPSRRSNQRSPTPWTAQRAIRPTTPASNTTTKNIVKNPAISAAHWEFT